MSLLTTSLFFFDRVTCGLRKEAYRGPLAREELLPATRHDALKLSQPFELILSD